MAEAKKPKLDSTEETAKEKKPEEKKKVAKKATEEVAEQEKAEETEEEPTDEDGREEEKKEDMQDETDEETDEDELEDELDEDEELDEEEIKETLENVLKEIFRTRKVKSASISQRRKARKNSIKVSRARNMDEEDIALTQEEKAHEEYMLLKRATEARRLQRLKVVLDGTMEDDELGYVVTAHLADKKSSEYVIKIPPSMLFDYEPKDFASEDGIRFFKSIVEGMIGAVTEVHVYEVDEAGHTANASRLSALSQLSSESYRSGRVVKGMIRTGTIIGVYRDRLRVEVDGADAVISSAEASWFSLEDLRQEFKKGQKVNVLIKEVEEDEVKRVLGKSFHITRIKASMKDAEERPNERYFSMYKLGQMCSGVIKKEPLSGGVFVRLQDRVDALCNPPITFVPHEGMKVMVRITRLKEDDKLIYGDILNEIR